MKVRRGRISAPALTLLLVMSIAPAPAHASGWPCQGHRATIVGSLEGDDKIVGTPRRDVIVTAAGNDVIRARGGNDVICSGQDDDVVVSGAGHDVISMGTESDRVVGGSGNDKVLNDDVFCLECDDELHLGSGRDVVAIAEGGGIVDGGPGNDELYAYGPVYRAGPAYEFSGGPGDDWIAGDRDNEIYYGGPGDDMIGPAGGSDQVVAGPGNDVVSEGSEGALIDSDVIEGGPGNDSLAGSPDPDVISGGPGADSVTGDDGSDDLAGGSGNDWISFFDDFVTDERGLVIDLRAGWVMRYGTEGLYVAPVEGLPGVDAIVPYGEPEIAAGFENVDATVRTDIIFGTDRNNKIEARDELDVVEGRAGFDTCKGAEIKSNCEAPKGGSIAEDRRNLARARHIHQIVSEVAEERLAKAEAVSSH